MSQETCGTCRFWVETMDPHGDCRRYPPQLLASIHGKAYAEADDREYSPQDYALDSTTWPITERVEWCGEHQPHPTQPPR